MTQPAKVQEPSMEEILASIRRIIADDEAKPPAAEKPPVAVAPAPPPPKPAAAAPAPSPPLKSPAMSDIPPSKSPPPAAAKPAPPAPPPAPAPPPPAPSVSNNQDDIDALLSGLDEATTEDEIRPAPPPPPAPEADVFELTDDMAVASAAPPEQAEFQKVDPDDDLEFTESAASRVMQRPAAYEPSSRAFDSPAGPPAPAILSQTT